MAEDKGQFISKWFFPITQTSKMMFELLKDSETLKKVADDYYFEKARQYKLIFKIKNWIKLLYDWLSPAEKALWDNPLTKKLFEIWCENVEGVKHGVRVEAQERIAFLEYLYELLEISHHPKKSELYENYQNLAFSLKMLRPNNQAHVYLPFSFVLRPLKKYIQQYLRMAIITGDYELLFRRFPPYYSMLSINAAPGKRTPLDSRGIDFPPIIYKLDLKYNVALEFKKVQTRSNNRFITCPIVYDINLEREKKAEIEKKEADLKGIFEKFPDIMTVDFGEDGKVYNTITKKEVPFYGMRRGRYLPLLSEINLLKAIPRPATDSGLVIRFNILHPIVPLLEGINRKREVSLEEVRYAMKCLDLMRADVMNPTIKPKDRRAFPKVVEEVFLKKPDEAIPGLSAETNEFIREIDRLEKEDPSGETAWRYLIDRMNEGKGAALLQALCLRLINDGFDAVFSLWPLITGLDIQVEYGDEAEITRALEDAMEKLKAQQEEEDLETRQRREEAKKTKQKTLLPLLDVLKREMEDLLKNVFTRYLDISAATNRYRTEPILAGMIVEYCLNVKSNKEEFIKRLRDHLKRHYDIHYGFLKEYLRSGAPTVLQKIHRMKPIMDDMSKISRLDFAEHKSKDKEPDKQIKEPDKQIKGIDEQIKEDFDLDKQIEEDINGIMKLIENTRDRLYSFSEGSRLLCFIDPYSVDVQLGRFEYDGAGIEDEEKFISDHLKRQYEIAEAEGKKRLEIEKFNIERKGNKEIFDGKHVVLKVKENYAKAEAEHYRNITEAQLYQLFSEARYMALQKLKEGDIKEYAKLALLKAHHDDGVKGVEEILEKSPNLVMAIDPELHHHREMHEIKAAFLKLLEKDPTLANPLTTAMMLSKDFKDIVATDIYKGFNQTLQELLKSLQMRMGMSGIGMGMGMGGGGYLAQQNIDKQNVKEQNVEKQNLLPPKDNPGSNAGNKTDSHSDETSNDKKNDH